MSSVRVRALADFYDKKAGVGRRAGDEFEAAPERVAEYNACGVEQGGSPLVAEVRPRPARTRADGTDGE